MPGAAAATTTAASGVEPPTTPSISYRQFYEVSSWWDSDGVYVYVYVTHTQPATRCENGWMGGVWSIYDAFNQAPSISPA